MKKYTIINKLNKFVGFIGFETGNKNMIFKIKNTLNYRSTGSRCIQAGKSKIMNILNDIEGYEKFKKKETKEGVIELCIRQEFILREYDRIQKDDKTWFLNTESAILHEFEKREK